MITIKRVGAILLTLIILFTSGCAVEDPSSSALQASSSGSQSPLAPDSTQVPLERVQDAYEVLQPVVQETPLVGASGLSTSTNAEVFLKLENLQTTGSFKLRGAYFAVSQLTDEERQRGIVACSSGNHAQGVAYAAQAFGVPATIFIPESAPQEKIEATKSYGVDVVVQGASFEEAKVAAERFVEETNSVYIAPYDNVDIIAGQGTIALEISEQLEDVDIVIVPVGGGGLISGVASTIKALKPNCLVYGVETESMNSMQRSLQEGRPVSLPHVDTLADGIAVSAPSDLTYGICRDYVDDIVTVTEQEIADAMRYLLEDEKLVAEGAGATSVAALMSGKIPVAGQTVVCIVSGGNVPNDALMQLLE